MYFSAVFGLNAGTMILRICVWALPCNVEKPLGPRIFWMVAGKCTALISAQDDPTWTQSVMRLNTCHILVITQVVIASTLCGTAASTHQEAMHQGQPLHRGRHLGYQCKVGCMCKACDLWRPQVEGQLTFNKVMFCIQDILHRLDIGHMYELLSCNPGSTTEQLQSLEAVHSENELFSIGCSRQ